MAKVILRKLFAPFLLAGERVPENLSRSGSGPGAGREKPGGLKGEVGSSLRALTVLLGFEFAGVVATSEEVK